MKIAVTAASGQLGAAIVKAAFRLIGFENVIAVARAPERAKDLGVVVRPGSYDDRSALERAFAGIGTVLLVSGMDAPDRRVVQHRHVIEAAKAAGVQKVAYASVQGPLVDSAFSPIVQSNRQTEEDLKVSGLAWVIGRNGIYIEPDVEYIDKYAALGEIVNCAGNGLCGYTTRPELAYAYARFLTVVHTCGRTGAPNLDRLLRRHQSRPSHALTRRSNGRSRRQSARAARSAPDGAPTDLADA